MEETNGISYHRREPHTTRYEWNISVADEGRAVVFLLPPPLLPSLQSLQPSRALPPSVSMHFRPFFKVSKCYHSPCLSVTIYFQTLLLYFAAISVCIPIGFTFSILLLFFSLPLSLPVVSISTHNPRQQLYITSQRSHLVTSMSPRCLVGFLSYISVMFKRLSLISCYVTLSFSKFIRQSSD